MSSNTSSPPLNLQVQQLPAGISDFSGSQFAVNGIYYMGTTMVGSSWWLAYQIGDPYKIIRLIYQPQ
jgi:hypothetical protein